MDDIGRAVVMIGHIVLFVIACTTSMYLYNRIDAHIDMVFLSKDYSNQGNSIVGSQEEAETRKMGRAEVILAITELKHRPAGYKVIVETDMRYTEFSYIEATNEIYNSSTGSSYTHGSPVLYNILKSFYSKYDVFELTEYGEDYLKYEKI